MSVLETIIESKRGEVERSKKRLPVGELERLVVGNDPPRGFAAALRSGPSPRVIAEVKRASPSKGVLRPDDPLGSWQPAMLAQAYERGGARALSVLTDVHYFWGHPDALPACREATSLPVLRKDFIIDPYQVLESRWLGADAVLLIARALPPEALLDLGAQALGLGMDVLLEVHEESELDRALAVPEAIIGVNNRDLSTLKVDIQNAARMRSRISTERLVVGESGLSEPAHLTMLADCGIDAFLIGEHLATHSNPEGELRRLRGA